MAPFLRSCASVTTLGIRPTFGDYTVEERDLIKRAERIYFPTPRFVDIFQALEKPTFPNPWTYRYQRSRILQKTLLQYAKYPHPHSRIYFGAKQKRKITEDFHFPLTVLSPLAISGTEHQALNEKELNELLRQHTPVVIREAVEWEERIILVCVCFECIGALRKISIEAGGVSFEPVPLKDAALREIIRLTRKLLNLARIDDIAMEWGVGNGGWQVIEMRRPPFRFGGPEAIINRHEYICRLIRSGKL